MSKQEQPKHNEFKVPLSSKVFRTGVGVGLLAVGYLGSHAYEHHHYGTTLDDAAAELVLARSMGKSIKNNEGGHGKAPMQGDATQSPSPDSIMKDYPEVGANPLPEDTQPHLPTQPPEAAA